MSVYRKPNSPTFFHYEFQCGGVRHRGSTKKRSRREAEAVERTLKEKARAELAFDKRPASDLTLAEGGARYVHEIEADQEIERQLARLLGFLGPDRQMAELTGDEIAKLVRWLRGQHKWGRQDMPRLSAATVNRTGVELLRRVFWRAKDKWGAHFPDEPKWASYLLPEPPGRSRELHADERAALELAIRPDGYADVVAFALASGFRLDECLLRWSEVNWQARDIKKIGKWGREIKTKITPEVAAILNRHKGHHPEFVFTYVAKRTVAWAVKGRRYGLVKGRRYPITYEGMKTQWKRTRKRAKVSDLRYHDLRHDFGTRVQRACGNIKITQRAMNHARIESTLRYINVREDEVEAALEAAQTPPTNPPTAEKKAG